jgi:hypothetical protein
MSLGGERWYDNMYIKPEVQEELLDGSIDKLQALTGDKTLPRGEWERDMLLFLLRLRLLSLLFVAGGGSGRVLR